MQKINNPYTVKLILIISARQYLFNKNVSELNIVSLYEIQIMVQKMVEK